MYLCDPFKGKFCVIVINVILTTLQRLYKSGDSDAMHKYTLHADDPDFIRARINAQQISNVRDQLCFFFSNALYTLSLYN